MKIKELFQRETGANKLTKSVLMQLSISLMLCFTLKWKLIFLICSIFPLWPKIFSVAGNRTCTNVSSETAWPLSYSMLRGMLFSLYNKAWPFKYPCQVGSSLVERDEQNNRSRTTVNHMRNVFYCYSLNTFSIQTMQSYLW